MAQPNFRAAMPDIQSMIAAKQKMPSGAENINTGLQGMMKGMEMVEAVDKMTKRRQSAKAMADYLRSDAGKKIVSETGLPPSVIENVEPSSLVSMQQTILKNKREADDSILDNQVKTQQARVEKRKADVWDDLFNLGEDATVKKYGKSVVDSILKQKPSIFEEMGAMFGAGGNGNNPKPKKFEIIK